MAQSRVQMKKKRPSRKERVGNLALLLISTEKPLAWLRIFGSMRTYYGDDEKAALRTFERDKQALRKMGIEVEAVKLEGEGVQTGYRVHPAMLQRLPLPLSSSELSFLLLINSVFRKSQWLPFKDRLLSLQAKALWQRGGGKEKKRKLFLSVTAPTLPVEMEVLEGVETALLKRKEVEIRGNGFRARIRPFGLLFREGRVCLLGEERGKGGKGVRLFDLHSVKQVRMDENLEVPDFDLPKNVDVEALLRLREWEGEDGRKVCLVWHRGEKKVKEEKVFVKDKERFFHYLLRFRSQVKLTAPPEMKKEFRTYLGTLASRYK